MSTDHPRKRSDGQALGGLRAPSLQSVIVITNGFNLPHLEEAKLKEAGATVLSLEEALVKGALVAQHILACLALSEVDKTRIKRLVKNNGSISWSSDGESVVSLILKRLEPKGMIKKPPFIPDCLD